MKHIKIVVLSGLVKLLHTGGMYRLKELASIQNSNVDKKSHEDDIPVLLCNYVDVYKNEFITASLAFMKATANESEIQRFEIKKDDVLINTFAKIVLFQLVLTMNFIEILLISS
ncbi:MAG: hypothetical protein Q9M11_01795 [Mariprofundaceae bacterium]|nr:hypothetical protein [Mariprofundaceae bacterium]